MWRYIISTEIDNRQKKKKMRKIFRKLEMKKYLERKMWKEGLHKHYGRVKYY